MRTDVGDEVGVLLLQGLQGGLVALPVQLEHPVLLLLLGVLSKVGPDDALSDRVVGREVADGLLHLDLDALVDLLPVTQGELGRTLLLLDGSCDLLLDEGDALLGVSQSLVLLLDLGTDAGLVHGADRHPLDGLGLDRVQGLLIPVDHAAGDVPVATDPSEVVLEVDGVRAGPGDHRHAPRSSHQTGVDVLRGRSTGGPGPHVGTTLQALQVLQVEREVVVLHVPDRLGDDLAIGVDQQTLGGRDLARGGVQRGEAGVGQLLPQEAHSGRPGRLLACLRGQRSLVPHVRSAVLLVDGTLDVRHRLALVLALPEQLRSLLVQSSLLSRAQSLRGVRLVAHSHLLVLSGQLLDLGVDLLLGAPVTVGGLAHGGTDDLLGLGAEATGELAHLARGGHLGVAGGQPDLGDQLASSPDAVVGPGGAATLILTGIPLLLELAGPLTGLVHECSCDVVLLARLHRPVVVRAGVLGAKNPTSVLLGLDTHFVVAGVHPGEPAAGVTSPLDRDRPAVDGPALGGLGDQLCDVLVPAVQGLGDHRVGDVGQDLVGVGLHHLTVVVDVLVKHVVSHHEGEHLSSVVVHPRDVLVDLIGVLLIEERIHFISSSRTHLCCHHPMKGHRSVGDHFHTSSCRRTSWVLVPPSP